jgi:spore photoproduct lyase
VWDHPRTAAVRTSFPRAQLVEIESLGELTNRKSTVWSYQKRAPKLVLASKTSQLVYPCSDVAPSFGHRHFYYAVPMQNCLYDCEYCYLQGMYNSAHLVLFVNQAEMHEAVRRKAAELGELYLCIAYDNDLLAMESKLGLVAEWVEALRAHPEVTVEVRTKSANFAALRELAPASNVVLAWTVSPLADPPLRGQDPTPGSSATGGHPGPAGGVAHPALPRSSAACGRLARAVRLSVRQSG